MHIKFLRRSFQILLLLLCIPLYGNDPDYELKNNFDKYIEVGEKAFMVGNYSKALENFTTADLLVDNTNLEQYKLVAKFNVGKVYAQIHSFGDALKYYNQALEITIENPDLEEKSLTVLVNIGNLYSLEGDEHMALEFYKRSYSKAKELNSAYNIIYSAVNLSDINIRLNNYGEARKYLDEVKNLPMSNEWRQTMYVNYAESYFREGKIKQAEKIMMEVLGNVDTTNENHCYLCVVKLLSEISNAKGDTKTAINYAKDGLKHSRSLTDRVEMYRLLSNIYYKDKQYQRAFKYRDSLDFSNDSLSKMIESGLYAANKVKLKIHDYQSEARHSKEKRQAERNLFILIIVLGIILFYFIFRSLKNRIIKQKQENIIAENKQKIYELELDKLSNDVAEKNRKLSAKALYLSGRNELIEEVINSIDQLPEIQSSVVHNHIRALKQHLKVDEEWDDFIAYFEQVNPNFLKTLQERHPQLTPPDIRFICYLYMNLDLKEISSIFSITIEAARKRKQRISKKMDLDIDQLNEYILKLT